jgi:toxin ParE1/3/4
VSRPAKLTPAARREAAHAVRWLAKRNPQAARDLRQAIVDAAGLIGARPLLGRRRPDLLGGPYRVWSLVRFSYVLVYDPETEPVQILRLVHTKRDLPRALADLAERPLATEGTRRRAAPRAKPSR